VPEGSERELQRWLLLELLSAPPVDGDDIDYLAGALEASRAAVEQAVEELVSVGLAVRVGDRVRASAAAWRFEVLCPHESLL
jgi:predicted transcriptional regulator